VHQVGSIYKKKGTHSTFYQIHIFTTVTIAISTSKTDLSKYVKY